MTKRPKINSLTRHKFNYSENKNNLFQDKLNNKGNNKIKNKINNSFYNLKFSSKFKPRSIFQYK